MTETSNLEPASRRVARWSRWLSFLHPAPRRPVCGDETGFCVVGADQRVPYRIIRSPRRKRTLSLSIESGTTVRVAAPLRTSRGIIEAFICNRAPWIARHLTEARPVVAVPPQFVDGARMTYLGYSCLLCVTQHDLAVAACRLAPRRFLVNIGGGRLEGETLRQEVRLEIMLWLKKRAQTKLQRRLDLWARRLGVCYQRLVISNPRQRWGSCSARNVIRLNWRLIMAPLPLIDYVVAHELCHVVHKNHGPGFWHMLATVMPDYQNRRRQLRKIEGGMVL